MPSQTEIARHWGVSQPYVAKLVKKGCPTNSLRAADNWRDANARQRAPTNAKRDCKFAVVERIPRRKFLTILKPSNTGDSLLDVLNNCITVANCAFEEFDHARINNLPTMSARISDHSSALIAFFKVEKMYRQEQERQSVLVNKHDILAMVRRCMDAVLKRLRRLPQECGPQCASQDPVRSYEILQRAVDEVLVAGQDAIRNLETPKCP